MLSRLFESKSDGHAVVLTPRYLPMMSENAALSLFEPPGRHAVPNVGRICIWVVPEIARGTGSFLKQLIARRIQLQIHRCA